jgi:RNA polymerase sigma-70 factor (ECF subfamily)
MSMRPVRTERDDLAGRPDADLVALARRGEGAAFAAIMQRYNRRLYRAARSIVRDDVEAEDVVQEAYVRAFSALGTFRGEASLSTWLTRIVLNEALGRIRRQRPTEELEVLDREVQSGETCVIMFPGVSSMPDPESAAARAEVRRLLEDAVDDLPDAFRVVFMMRDVEGLSIEETATHLGIRAETVKTRLHRARKLLREALDDRLATVLKDTFPFLGVRCARITDAVLARLGLVQESGHAGEAGGQGSDTR